MLITNSENTVKQHQRKGLANISSTETFYILFHN